MVREWTQRFGVAVVAASLLVVGLAVAAQATTVVGSGPVVAGESFTVACPAGETFQSGLISFFRREGARKAFATVAFSPTSDNSGGTVVVPKGARFASWQVQCAPTTTAILQETFLIPGGLSATLTCPAGSVVDPGSVTLAVLAGSGQVGYVIDGGTLTVTNNTAGDPGTEVQVTASCVAA